MTGPFAAIVSSSGSVGRMWLLRVAVSVTLPAVPTVAEPRLAPVTVLQEFGLMRLPEIRERSAAAGSFFGPPPVGGLLTVGALPVGALPLPLGVSSHASPLPSPSESF